MNIRSFIVFFSVMLCISCGGSKKTVATKSKRIVSPPKREITKTVIKEVPKEKIKAVTIPSPKKVEKPVSYKERVQNYIEKYAAIAKLEMAKYGIPASITLAQGILESGAGAGDLTSRSKNHFGIKCHGWKGEKVYHDDDLDQECFRKYDKASQSFRDHSLFLKNRKRYSKLFTYKVSDYRSWAYGLRAAGYATDQKYPVKLISIIKHYELYKYDKDVLGTRYEEKKEASKLEKITVVKEPKVINNNQYVVQKGDTLYSISRKYNIKVAELKKYNSLIDNTIAIGQVLQVTPK